VRGESLERSKIRIRMRTFSVVLRKRKRDPRGVSLAHEAAGGFKRKMIEKPPEPN